MFKPLGLDHVVLRVRDQARSRRFYEDVLGCTLAKFNERISLIHLRFGEALIDLLPATEAGPVGPDHFCLSIQCDDLKAVAEALPARSRRPPDRAQAAAFVNIRPSSAVPSSGSNRNGRGRVSCWSRCSTS